MSSAVPSAARRALALATAGWLMALALPVSAAPSGLDRQGAPVAAAPVAVQAAPAGRPLVVVLDTSGSMSEDDGRGTIKLAGAQAALSQVIREQRPGAQIGLWTYPGSGDCDGGGFRIPVQDLDQSSMIRTIRGLDADGDTPTGEALRSVTDDLSANGYEGANVLLISDGLSTCDEPCPIARQIVRNGFDLTVQAAGFQISDEGMKELSCIAAATGGNTYNATDADELGQVVQEAARAELSFEVSGIPTRTPAGSASRVTVTVSNESAVDVTDARISFAFGGTFNDGIIPAVLPPLVRLGNLPSGSTATHTWLVSYGSRGKIGTAAYRIAAWGANAQPRTAEGTVEVVDANQGFDQAGGDIAGLQGKRIAILGDSYSSGEGAGDYLSGTDQNSRFGDNQCHKSPHTYLYPLFDSADVELIACSGATTHWIGSDPASGVREEQVPLLEERQDKGGPVAAAFMTIGGNDITFGDIISTCLQGDCAANTAFVDKIDRLVSGVGAELVPTYDDVYTTLNDAAAVDERGGLAPLYVLAYPQPFPEPKWAHWCLNFNAGEIDFANGLVADLNDQIQKSVNVARHRGFHVRMITTLQEAFLPDNAACSRPGSEPFVNEVNLVTGGGGKLDQNVLGLNYVQEFLHPNAKGYRAETNTILAWSVNEDTSLPDGVDEWRPQDDDGRGVDLTTTWLARVLLPPLPSAGPVVLDAALGAITTDPTDVRAGESLEVRVVNAAPRSRVTVVTESRARVVGTVTVGDDGTGRGTVQMPRRTSSGIHQLSVLAQDADGQPVLATQQIDVSRAIPLWLVPVLALTLFGFLGWLACRVWEKRRVRPARPG